MVELIIITVFGLITVGFLIALFESYHNESKKDKRNKDLRNYWRDE